MVLIPAAAAPAHAQTLRGKAQVQFQRIETNHPGRPRFVTTSWLQTYELNHSMKLHRRTQLSSQFTYTELSYVDRPDAMRSPFGRLRIQDPLFGLTASYRPTRVTSEFGDSAVANEVTHRAEESRFDGYVSIPRGPRVSGSWVRVHRKQDLLSAGGSGTTRNLRAYQTLGPLSVRGGYTDRLRDPVPAEIPRTQQRAWDGGAALNLRAGTRASMNLDYSYFRTERPLPDRPADRTFSHQASMQSSFAQSPKSNWSLSYIVRRSGLENGNANEAVSHDGSMVFTHQPTRAVTFTSSGGVRSVRELSGYATQEYASATLSSRGEILPGWSADGGLSHTTNWVPDRRAFGQQGAYAFSRARVWRGFDMTGNLQVATTSDTTAGGGSVTVQASYRAEFEPWRTLRVVFSDNHFNTGPRLFENATSSRYHTWDVRWMPVSGFELRGTHSVTRTAPSASARLATTTMSIRYDPSPRLQLWTSYTSSDHETRASTDQLQGRKIVTVRAVSAVTPTITVSAGASVLEPDRPNEARQYDVSVAKSFGR